MRILLASLSIVTALSSTRTASAQQAGDPVEIRLDGAWYRGRVLGQPTAGRWEVAYQGCSAEWNQLVGADRLRSPTSGGGPVGGPLAGLARGAHVLVSSGGAWYPARVLWVLRDSSAARIRYVGYGSEWDELVGPRRLRSGDAPHRTAPCRTSIDAAP